ncbi:BlaI/MecI/CopY family transcriptional regulator [Parasphingorhabdus flavimaris]|jgi:BlaI family transcriptional regulator, penicillinase repressor|uniref:BlaI/MecI/CopY family transcriptional regulator n=1 Tax=Parasphingorhabdus flavimaris TaxID=266812 RepID=A0ABX2MYB2_9SPHN|nr:BlaI/MecI/CopY family transcriptional regulator [Parasphingorhabdus flavimaris]NVD26396.1 BlaI/MecI/CopY family transcriptional regulator [Parasphingorhabdus flavimaris]|tara:strand:+ start:10018 stop:10386 length:369 start_codon:yes stop_codon:yes gene_type:complete
MTERISDAEHAVMEVLWKRAPLTATEVADQVVQQKDWSLQTVKTLLSRLAAKAVVGTERDGRRFLYSPLVERDDYLTGVSRNFVDRLFGGKVMPLVAHLAEADELSADDIREIEELLRELKK